MRLDDDGTRLDPATIHVTLHALDRYLERRGKGSEVGTTYGRRWADEKLRELLGRCSHTLPPVEVKDGRRVRRYSAAGFIFVVAADHSALVTFVKRDGKHRVAGGQARTSPARLRKLKERRDE